MNCAEAKQRMVAGWAGDAGGQPLENHLEGCEECRSEAMLLGDLWERMGSLPAPEPSAALRIRWQSAMESLELRGPALSDPLGKRKTNWFAWWPKSAAWQVAIAGCCLLIGLFSGLSWRGVSLEKSELAALRQEVTGTREMVALSLLRENTASERLKGVDYSGRMSRLEPDVVAALLRAVTVDPNVNVRLAAIDALMRASGDSRVRESLLKSIPTQESPMVQAALIDYLTDAHDRAAAEPLRRFAAKPELNPLVRQRANRALQILSQ